jgi:hypothetical protein
MPVITINRFGGISPVTPPRYLGDHQAQTAVNCPTWTGSLAPMLGTTKVQDFAKVGDIQSLYRFGQDVDSKTQYWFHWTGDVDVVRGFIHGDTSERTFFTGDGAPKATDNTLALTGAGAAYPHNAHMLGVPVPTTPLTAEVGGEADTVAVTPFDAETDYFINDMFLHDGMVYQVTAVQDSSNATPPNATYYEALPDYSDSPSFIQHSPYAVGVIFNYLGVAYRVIATQDTPNIVPPNETFYEPLPAYNTLPYFSATADYSVGDVFMYDTTAYRVSALQGLNATPPNAAYYEAQPDYTAVLAPGAFVETRVYVYTVVNAWGEESAPSPLGVGSTIDVASGQHSVITFPPVDSGEYDPQYRRLYRSVNGVYLLVYVDLGDGELVADIPIATLQVTDDTPADELGEEMPSLTWLPPSENLKGLVGLPNGLLAGFDGITVSFCEPYRPFAWPVQYQQSVGYEIVGLGTIDTTVVALTVGKPFFIQGSHPDSVVVVEADVSQACVSKDSIVSMGGVVFYASPDGLVALSTSGSNIVTAARFDRAQWQAYFSPASIKAYAFDKRYIAFYDTGVVQGGFVFDPATGEFTVHNIAAKGGYNDLLNDTLFLSVGSELHTWGTGSALTYTWRSKKFTMPAPIGFSCFRVKAEAYPVTFSLYKDGALHYVTTVSDGGIHRLPAGVGYDFEVELVGSVEVYSVQLATSPTELHSG